MSSKVYPGDKEVIHVTQTNARIVSELLSVNEQYIICIRPWLGDYDNTYYESNPVANLPKTLIQALVIEATLEEFLSWDFFLKRLNFQSRKKHFIMNDTHYYIPEIPSNCVNSLFYVTGLLFEQIPGRYYLPLMEGEYSIFSKDGF